jgi:predicted transcriptional regulator
MIALREESAGNYSKSIIVRSLSDDMVRHARRIFAEYKMRGVMVNDSFDDDVWIISDEKVTAKLMSFSLRSKVIASWLDSNEEEYRLCVKAYILNSVLT